MDKTYKQRKKKKCRSTGSDAEQERQRAAEGREPKPERRLGGWDGGGSMQEPSEREMGKEAENGREKHQKVTKKGFVCFITALVFNVFVYFFNQTYFNEKYVQGRKKPVSGEEIDVRRICVLL